LFILDHSCWTWNIRKFIKGSKDVDSSLVSNENISKILPSSGLTQVRYQQSNMAKNLPYLWRHSQKKWNPKQFFFIIGLKICWVFWGFQQLS